METSKLLGMVKAIQEKENAVRNAQYELQATKRAIVQELADSRVYDALTINTTVLRHIATR